MTLRNVLEALVFGSPKPVSTRELAALLKAAGAETELELAKTFSTTSEGEIAEALQGIREELESTGRGFRLVEQVNGWTLVTDSEAAPWVRQLYPEAKPTRLSGPALETLAIIAYRQPVTRGDVEAVRGVAVDGVMQVLLDRSLVKITGRADVPGRPLLYGTTEYFLQHFGLKSTEELPNSAELKSVPLPKAPEAEPASEATEGAQKKSRKVKRQVEASQPTEPESPVQASEEALSGKGPGPEAPQQIDLTPEELRSMATHEDDEPAEEGGEAGSPSDSDGEVES